MDVLEGKAKPACTVEEGLQTLRVNVTLLAVAFKPNWLPVGPQ